MDDQIENLHYLDMQDMGLTIFNGGRTLCRKDLWGSQDDWSRQTKLYCPVSGSGWVEVAGRTTQLKAGKLYLIPPHVRMSYGTSSDIVIDWLHFQLQSLYLDGRLGSVSKVHLFSREVTARLKPVCRSIESFLRERSTNDAFRIHAMLLELVGLTLARLPAESPLSRQAHERFVPALRLLDDHAVEHPSLSDVARAVNLSPEHCHRLFQETFHTTPLRYAETRRMTLAKNLLSDGLVSVTEAAEQCGYSDPFYFSRVFRRYYGVSPGRVRRGLAIIGPKP